VIRAKDAVIWTNRKTHEVTVLTRDGGTPAGFSWGDPIGANYTAWREDMSNDARIELMHETVFDLFMQGFAVEDVWDAFDCVRGFNSADTVVVVSSMEEAYLIKDELGVLAVEQIIGVPCLDPPKPKRKSNKYDALVRAFSEKIKMTKKEKV
jgi:hypothetical protein